MIREVSIAPGSSFGLAAPVLRFVGNEKTSASRIEISIYQCLDWLKRRAQFEPDTSDMQVKRMKRRQHNIAALQLAADVLETHLE